MNKITMYDIKDSRVKTIGHVIVNDYSKLLPARGQRSFKIKSINNLSNSVDNIGLISRPDVCIKSKRKGTFTVLDGNHRIKVAKAKGISIVCNIVKLDDNVTDNDLMIQMNASETRQNWRPEDYLNNGVVYHKSDDYIKLSCIYEETGIALAALIEIFAYDQQQTKRKNDFQLGEWRMSTKDLGNRVLIYSKELLDTGYLPFAQNANFLRGFVKCVSRKRYCQKHMLNQVTACGKTNLIHDGDKPNQHADMLNKVYNHKCLEEDQVYIGS